VGEAEGVVAMSAFVGVIVGAVLDLVVLWWLWLRDPPLKRDRRKLGL
jgi:hypothetical protein